tara:strand:+ start:99 stop:341 length:243 start_codon:yes stop_codon:yes gene_type:complete
MDKHLIYIVKQGWFFWDETWANRIGPFQTEEEATKKCRSYLGWLDAQYDIEDYIEEKGGYRGKVNPKQVIPPDFKIGGTD